MLYITGSELEGFTGFKPHRVDAVHLNNMNIKDIVRAAFHTVTYMVYVEQLSVIREIKYKSIQFYYVYVTIYDPELHIHQLLILAH